MSPWHRLASPWMAAALLTLAVLAAYANSLTGPFVFDDGPAILDNPSIRALWPPWAALSPPATGGGTVSGRPLLNLSLALNWAFAGPATPLYHATNLAIHLGAGLLLWGLVRRALASAPVPPGASPARHPQELASGSGFDREHPPLPVIEPPAGPAAAAAIETRIHLAGGEGRLPLPAITAAHVAPPEREFTSSLPSVAPLAAFLGALLWALHPLQTSAVTYVIQRAESLAGAFVLLALYAFARATRAALGTKSQRRWLLVTAAASAAAMATKESAAAVPLLLLLYDRTFVAGTFTAAWRARGRFHLGSAVMSWSLLAVLVLATGGRDRSAGLDAGVTPFAYALTQAQAIVHYLRLVVWPQPLVFDYGRGVVAGAMAVAPQLLALAGLAAATVWALVRRPRLGFCGVAFFALLAPSSSFAPIATQTMAEHRMYLPLAALLVPAAVWLVRVRPRLATPGLLLVALAWGATTFARNRTYASAETLWRHTAIHAPANARAHLNLGVILAESGRPAEAAASFATAVQLAPADSDAHNNLAAALVATGRAAEALPHYEAAVRLAPRSPRARHNFAKALVGAGRPLEARDHLRTALSLDPGFAAAHADLGAIEARLGDAGAAALAYRAALRLQPADAGTTFALANLLAQQGQLDDAAATYEALLQLAPADARAWHNLGNTRLLQRRPADAAASFERALALTPDAPDTLTNLASALALLGRYTEAEPLLRRALEIDPQHRMARSLLERLARRRNP